MSVQEKRVADYVAIHLGLDVLFLVPNRQKGTSTPDIEMAGLRWEIKSPSGKSSRTIENNLRSALRQSANIILDLRQMDGRIPTKKLLLDAEHRFINAKKISRLIVITKEQKHVDFRR